MDLIISDSLAAEMNDPAKAAPYVAAAAEAAKAYSEGRHGPKYSTGYSRIASVESIAEPLGVKPVEKGGRCVCVCVQGVGWDGHRGRGSGGAGTGGQAGLGQDCGKSGAVKRCHMAAMVWLGRMKPATAGCAFGGKGVLSLVLRLHPSPGCGLRAGGGGTTAEAS